jgi:hypothetical protein
MFLESNLLELVKLLGDRALHTAGVIPWSSPIPSFGDLGQAKVATLGLNPSNREFVDARGDELDGPNRRFHTLKSLSLPSWAKAKDRHLELMAESCRTYFNANPYDGWFKRLDEIIVGTKCSYYERQGHLACHLDLIPFATAEKWMALSNAQRVALLSYAGDTLGQLVRDSSVNVLILNGASVVAGFERAAGISLRPKVMPSWALPRKATPHVPGIGYRGKVHRMGRVSLRREVLVLGFNHNIQSSFGVTKVVKSEIAKWIEKQVSRTPYETERYSVLN